MAAAQTFKNDGDWDSAACLKEFVIIPGAASKKVRTSLGIDNPGKFDLNFFCGCFCCCSSSAIHISMNIHGKYFLW